MREIYCKVNETPPKPFDCNCGGKTKIIDDANVLHACIGGYMEYYITYRVHRGE